jgi:hypothetical protein
MVMTIVVAVMATVKSGRFDAVAALLLVKDTLVCIELKVEWARELVWTFWRILKSHTPVRNQTLDYSVYVLVTVPTARKKL